MTTRPVVAVCSGSDCAKDERAAHKALLRGLRDESGIDVVTTKCLKLCHGPVAVLDVRGTPVVVDKLRKPKRRRAAIAAATGDPDALSSLSSRVVDGKAARRAIERARQRV